MYTILYKLFVLASTRALIMIAVNNAIVLLTSISSERISCQSSQFTIILTRNRKHKRWYERWPWCWKLNIYLSREGVACCRPWIRLSSITSSNPAIVLTDTFKLFWKNFTDRQRTGLLTSNTFTLNCSIHHKPARSSCHTSTDFSNTSLN